MPATVVWFRRDLRLADNPALAAAAERGGSVVPVYLPDWEGGSSWPPGAAARRWLNRSLERLAEDLRSLGAPLLTLAGDPVTVLPQVARSAQADLTVWNALYEPFSRDLDDRVRAELERAGVATQAFPAALLFEPEGHLSRAGRRFVQFGAFWRSCLAQPEPRAPLAAPLSLVGIPPDSAQDLLSTGLARGTAAGSDDRSVGLRQESGPASIWQPGEGGAQRRLARFLNDALADYPTGRDYPAVEGVSRLSPHLHFGEISPHQVWHAAREAAFPRSAGSGRGVSRWGPGAASEQGAAKFQEGADAFLRQLGWREFGHYLLYHFPTIPVEPFRREFARFAWHDDPEGLTAWKEGETGFALVDAGMRQLQAEGWIHNRVRMVVASFLAKDLLIPWQEGAAWFSECLVDADLANNTLGWQWTAGSGPDAAPYFRVYNPDLQAQRFDPAREYIDRWLPEGPEGRPPPLVDHALARLRALEAFRAVR